MINSDCPGSTNRGSRFIVKYHSLCEWYKKLIAIQGDIQEKPPEVR